MVIYIDGPNNTGKTTLIKELAKRLEKDYKVSIFHCDEKFENTFEAYMASCAVCGRRMLYHHRLQTRRLSAVPPYSAD